MSPVSSGIYVSPRGITRKNPMANYLTIIVAAHNAEATIGETLDSVLAQEFDAWEAVVVDDGSTDRTAEIVRSYSLRDRRVRLHSQANHGVSVARNAGLARAAHPWVLFLDADDWLAPQALAHLALAAEKPGVDVAYGGWTYLTPDGFPAFGLDATRSGMLFPYHALACRFALHSFLLKKDLVISVGAFDPTLTTCEDWDLWQRVARAGAVFEAVDETVALYRIRARSASTDGTQMLADSLRVLRQAYTADARVSAAPWPDGLPAGELPRRTQYVVVTCAGLSAAAGIHPTMLLEHLPDDAEPIDAVYAAGCFVQSLLFGSGEPMRNWPSVTRRSVKIAETFFKNLECLLGRRGLADEAMAYMPLLLRMHMAPLGTSHRLAGALASIVIDVLRAKRFVTSPRSLKEAAARFVRMAARVSPAIRRTLRLVKAATPGSRTRAEFEALFSGQEDPWDYTNAYERLKYEQTLELLPNGPIRSALELACAEGHFSVQLAPCVGHLLATDISSVAVDRTARRCADFHNITYETLDFVRDEIPGTFDLIVCSESLYYIGTHRQLGAVARKFKKALNPGGHLLMAHANVVIDDPAAPGFGWEHRFGGKGIGEAHAAVDGLEFLREVRTPLYRIQLFRRQASSLATVTAPVIVRANHHSPLPTEVEEQIFWNGMTERLPILMYHRIASTGADELAPWRVMPKAFEEQLRFLRDHGFHSTTFKQWRGYVEFGTPIPAGAVMLTFDDGFVDFADEAWPLLRKYGFDATLFVVSNHVGGSNTWDHHFGDRLPLLGWSDLRALNAEGVDVGSHTATHRSLTAINPIDAYHDLKRSKRELEDRLGSAVRSVAYPYGYSSPFVHLSAAAGGYDYGVTARRSRAGLRNSMLALPRVEIEGADTIERFAKKLGRLPFKPSKSVAA